MGRLKCRKVARSVELVLCLPVVLAIGIHQIIADEPISDDLAKHRHFRLVAAKIEEIEKKTFDELVANMGDLWVTQHSGAAISALAAPELDFPLTLANRNTRRLVAELDIPAPHRSRELCRGIFERHFARYKVFYDEKLKSLENGTARGSDEGKINHLAICNSLFLTATFCDTADLAAQLRKVFDLSAVVSAQLKLI